MSGLFRLSLQSYSNAPIPFINANKCDIPRHDWLPPPPKVHCTGEWEHYCVDRVWCTARVSESSHSTNKCVDV